mgnify:FL=1
MKHGITLAISIACMTMASGCSSFSDTVNIYIGDGNQMFSVAGSKGGDAASDTGKTAPDGKAMSPMAVQPALQKGFRCSFESHGEKPSIFSTKTTMRGYFECVKTE